MPGSFLASDVCLLASSHLGQSWKHRLHFLLAGSRLIPIWNEKLWNRLTNIRTDGHTRTLIIWPVWLGVNFAVLPFPVISTLWVDSFWVFSRHFFRQLCIYSSELSLSLSLPVSLTLLTFLIGKIMSAMLPSHWPAFGYSFSVCLYLHFLSPSFHSRLTLISLLCLINSSKKNGKAPFWLFHYFFPAESLYPLHLPESFVDVFRFVLSVIEARSKWLRECNKTKSGDWAW